MAYTYETYINDTEGATVEDVSGTQPNPYSGEYALGTEYPGGTVNLGDVTLYEPPGYSETVTLKLASSVANTIRAQSFIFTHTGLPDGVFKVTVKLKKTGSPTDNIIVALYSDDELLPGSLLASAIIDGSTLTTLIADYAVTITGFEPQYNTRYWLHLSRSDSPSAVSFYNVSVMENLDIYPERHVRFLDPDWWSFNDKTLYLKLHTTQVDEILSVVLVCSMCGIPVKRKKDLVKVGQFYRCPRCVDEEL